MERFFNSGIRRRIQNKLSEAGKSLLIPFLFVCAPKKKGVRKMLSETKEYENVLNPRWVLDVIVVSVCTIGLAALAYGSFIRNSWEFYILCLLLGFNVQFLIEDFLNFNEVEG